MERTLNDIDAACAIQIPKLSATNSTTEPWRIQRLNRIIGKLNAFTYNRYKYDLLGKLTMLHDENDALEITWTRKPTAAERAVTSHVWSEVSQSAVATVSHRPL